MTEPTKCPLCGGPDADEMEVSGVRLVGCECLSDDLVEMPHEAQWDWKQDEGVEP